MNHILGLIIGSFVGFASGAAVAFGVSSFVITTGLFPRMIQKTQTADRARGYEDMILLGAMLGCLASVYTKQMSFFAWHGWAGGILTGGIGLFMGIFTGCLAVALAEVLNVIPIMFRLIKPAGSGEWVLLFLALGKMAGSCYYFREVIRPMLFQ